MRLLLGKFGAAEHEKYVNFIQPRQLGEVTFRKTIQMKRKYLEQSSLFNTCWQCLTLRKRIMKTTHNEIIPVKFKCLIFVQGLTLPSEKEVRTRLLTKLGQDQK